MRWISCLLLLLTGSAYAAPGLELVGADGIDVTTGYLKPLPASLEAGRRQASDVASCTKHVVIDHKQPRSVAVSVYVTVGADDKVATVDLETDPSLKVKRKVTPAARCIGPLVKSWTLPDHETVILRFVLAGVPVKRSAKLPAGYVRSLKAVCDAVPDTDADIAAHAELIRKALAARPDADVKRLIASIGGFTPEMRRPVLQAFVANAGLARCPAFDRSR